MAKKDLLERLSRASSDARPRRPGAEGETRSRTDSVRTRVSKKVVRRRRKAAPAAEVRAEPVSRPVTAEVPAPPAAEPTPPAPEPVPQAEQADAPPREPTAEVPREPTAEAPAPAPTPEATPEPVAAAAAEPAAAEPAAAAPPADAPAAAGGERPERGRFAEMGLGDAVVALPPGYDPANPTAYRRQQPATPAATTGEKRTPGRGRRRVEAGGRPEMHRPRRPPRGRGGRGGRDRQRFGRSGRSRKKSGAPKKASPAPKGAKRKVRVDNVISVRELAHQLQVKAPIIMKHLIGMGMMVTLNEMLDIDTATLIAAEFDYEVDNVGFQEDQFLQHVEMGEEDDASSARPPVVTVMGHVDHGKTTLLDAIRSARVAAGEAGGITQHIGAYQVGEGEDLITFLDTPGHAAFTAMRARGASVTDLVVLVVAADDGVQPQTMEAINHSKAAGVPILVAINKMDKAGANPDQIKQQLSEHGLVAEEWGGETIFVPVSALKGEGIEDVLENIKLQAEILDLSANAERHAEGVVVEAKMERGRGAVATVLVQTGTLKRGDHVVLGSAFGKVRAMLDHKGDRIKEAGPSTPVELFGLSDLPEVGDTLAVVANEKNARKLAEHRADEKRQSLLANTRRRTAEDLFAAAQRANIQQLNVVLKADVGGTLQAILAALENMEVDGTEVRVLHSGVGDITESDINLVAANGALLLGFNTKVDSKARKTADALGVKPTNFSVIYSLLDFVEANLKGMLEPEYEEVRQGAAEVRALFKISRLGTIAGCYVLDGKIGRNMGVRVFRNNREIWDGKLSSLKRFKDDVREVKAGLECGIALDGFNDIEEGDVLEVFSMEMVEVA